MAKYGSGSVWFLIDGFDMIVNKLQSLRCKFSAITEPTHGLGDTWEAHTPTGISRAELAQEGAFFDDTANYMHYLQTSSGGTPVGSQTAATSPKVVCLGVAGNTTGQDFIGIKGEFQTEYEVLSQGGKLTRANATYIVTGNAEHGKIIRSLAATTADVTQYLDNGVLTSQGGSAYFQVTSIALGASTGVALTVLESAATSTAFTAVATVTTTGIGAWRVSSTDAQIERWLSSVVDFSSAATSGSPSITCFVGFARI
jgi:hypothetical protein